MGRPTGSRDRRGHATRAVPRTEPYARFTRAVGERMREVREQLDVSASEVAAALDVWPETVAKWEAATRTPTIANLYRYATALGVKLADLVEVEP